MALEEWTSNILDERRSEEGDERFMGPLDGQYRPCREGKRRYLRSEVFESHVRHVGVCSGRHLDCDDWRELCSFRAAGFNGRDGLKMDRLFSVSRRVQTRRENEVPSPPWRWLGKVLTRRLGSDSGDKENLLLRYTCTMVLGRSLRNQGSRCSLSWL